MKVRTLNGVSGDHNRDFGLVGFSTMIPTTVGDREWVTCVYVCTCVHRSYTRMCRISSPVYVYVCPYPFPRDYVCMTYLHVCARESMCVETREIFVPKMDTLIRSTVQFTHPPCSWNRSSFGSLPSS